MDKRPNILFIFSDQQRSDTIGAYNPLLQITPNLDQMAKEGILFESAFTNQPVCGPARACLQTGKYPTEIGCHINNKMLPINEPTIAKILSANGYQVGYIGKWHLASQGFPGSQDDFTKKPIPRERRGGYKDFWLSSDVLEFTSHAYDGYMFDQENQRRDFPPNRYRPDVLTDWTIEYLKTIQKDKPFFLFLSYIEPHHQNDHHHYEGPTGSKEKFKNFPIPPDLKDTKGDWQSEMPDYLGAINALDANVGRIRQTLKECHLEENTIVIYASDHGSHFKTRNLEYKRSCHDNSIHIPLIMVGPQALGYQGGRRIPELVSLIDLPPTILTAAQIPPPSSMRGHAIQSLLLGRNLAWPQEVFIQISESQCGRALRTKEWTYGIKAITGNWFSKSSKWYHEAYLYNNLQDPGQHSNLIKKKELKAIRQQFRQIIRQKIREIEGENPHIF